MRILHVFDHSIPLHSGYTFRSYQILQEQRKLGLETLHVTGIKHLDPKGEKEEVEGLEFYRTIKYSRFLNALPIINQYEVVRSLRHRIDEIIATEQVDIIHAHSPVLNGMAALAAGRKHSIPVVYEIRAFWEDASASLGTCREGDLRYRFTKWLETRAVQKADAVTVICEGLKNDLVSRGIEAEKITLIPNAVDISKFSGPEEPDEDLKARLGLNGANILGFIGSFYEYEGLNILIDSMGDILEKMPETRLLLVGGGPEEDNLRAQVSACGLEEKIIFTGRVPHDRVQKYYNLVDIFVYPRKKMRLTDLVTPLKPLEAMAQHKLVAASDIGGHNELIEDGRTGILFKPDDPRDLALTIGKMMQDKASWPEILVNGRRYVEEVRNWTNSVANYPAVYEKILGRN